VDVASSGRKQRSLIPSVFVGYGVSIECGQGRQNGARAMSSVRPGGRSWMQVHGEVGGGLCDDAGRDVGAGVEATLW
jgi:hypothetical protein